MKKDKWVWMPHAGHFICGSDCRFRLNTYVGGYIVSTIGELLPDSGSWDIYANAKGITLEGRGDARRADFLKRVGWVEVGCDRTYETMVFKAAKAQDKCCPYRMVTGAEMDFAGYDNPGDALKGHMKLCAKWSKKK